jgi:hypothetical protein
MMIYRVDQDSIAVDNVAWVNCIGFALKLLKSELGIRGHQRHADREFRVWSHNHASKDQLYGVMKIGEIIGRDCWRI